MTAGKRGNLTVELNGLGSDWFLWSVRITFEQAALSLCNVYSWIWGFFCLQSHLVQSNGRVAFQILSRLARNGELMFSALKVEPWIRASVYFYVSLTVLHNADLWEVLSSSDHSRSLKPTVCKMKRDFLKRQALIRLAAWFYARSRVLVQKTLTVWWGNHVSYQKKDCHGSCVEQEQGLLQLWKYTRFWTLQHK